MMFRTLFRRATAAAPTLLVPAAGLLAACGLLAATGPALAAPPTVETRDGVPHVLNPATPQNGAITLDLEELWRAGGEEDAEEFFGVISSVQADARGWTYALDRQLNEVKVYDADGIFQKSIGHEGEGPGEFRGGGALFFLADGTLGVVQAMPGKIVLLSPDGTPVGEYPLPEDPAGGMRFLSSAAASGNRVAMQLTESARNPGRIQQTQALVIVDRDGKETARLSEQKYDIDFASPSFDERRSVRNTWATGRDGRIYAVPEPFGPYRIQIFSPEGGLERVVEREYEHRRRSAKEKDEAKARIIIRGLPDPKVEVADHDPDIRNLFPRDDGSLWVLTSRGGADLPDGVLGTFDVFDAEGRFVRQVSLRGEGEPEGDAFHVAGDRLYVVRRYRSGMNSLFAQGGDANASDDEDAEPMELIAYRIPRLP